MKQIRQLAVLFGHMIWHTFWSLVETIEDNAELTENLATKDMPTTEYITLGIGGGYGIWLISGILFFVGEGYFGKAYSVSSHGES